MDLLTFVRALYSSQAGATTYSLLFSATQDKARSNGKAGLLRLRRDNEFVALEGDALHAIPEFVFAVVLAQFLLEFFVHAVVEGGIEGGKK
jgi:hypothetical protein